MLFEAKIQGLTLLIQSIQVAVVGRAFLQRDKHHPTPCVERHMIFSPPWTRRTIQVSRPL